MSYNAVYEVAAKRGLRLNMEEGKAEVLWAFVGAGAKAKEHEVAAQQMHLKTSTVDGDKDLRVVQAYKHLGTWVHADGIPKHALTERMRAAKQA